MTSKSPFPGLDPFIEGRGLWGDFHDKMIVAIDDAISAVLPSRYVARVSNRNYIDWIDPVEDLKQRRGIIPDIALQEVPTPRERIATGNVAVAERLVPPVTMETAIEVEFHETYLDIWDVENDRQLVTSVEILSPTNKRTGTLGWHEYEWKRSHLLQGQANLVELDLLRSGKRHAMRNPWPDSPYYIMVARKDEIGRCGIWPAFSVSPLPKIPIPLLPQDSDLHVDLQPMVDAIYKRSRYFLDMHYDKPLRDLGEDEVALLANRKAAT
jgi:Protein of unknown function (DUF4058)